MIDNDNDWPLGNLRECFLLVVVVKITTATQLSLFLLFSLLFQDFSVIFFNNKANIALKQSSIAELDPALS